MTPTFSFTKKIDDINMYCELFAQKDKANIGFDGERFQNPPERLLILLHGNGEDGRIFSSQLNDFCQGFTVLTVDSRGQGKTTAGNQPFTVDLLAEDLSALCDSLGIGRFSAVGFSDGGNIAVTYAVRHPERLNALVIAGANLVPQGIKASMYIPLLLRYRMAAAKKNGGEESRIHRELLSLMVHYPHISHRLLSNIACPCLVMDGKRDCIKKSHTDSIAQAMPNAKRVTVPDAGHYIFRDNAPFVNREIMAFLTETAQKNDI